MSRVLTTIVAVGFLAAAAGFGDFAGVPNQAVFIARIIAGVCFLLLVAFAIANFQPEEKASRRQPRDHHP